MTYADVAAALNVPEEEVEAVVVRAVGLGQAPAASNPDDGEILLVLGLGLLAARVDQVRPGRRGCRERQVPLAKPGDAERCLVMAKLCMV